MKNKLLVLVMVLLVALGSTGCVKVVKIGEEASLTGKTEFNAGDNVAEFWDSLAMPEFTEKAVDLPTFLTEANGDLKSLADKYGKYSMGDTGELTYIVKGTATVNNVVTDKKAGYMEVTLDGYNGPEVIKLQIGTVFKGSAVRDSLSFIKFGDYTNQEEYAAVSQSIHELIQEKVIDPVDVKSLKGKQIEFTGCFSVSDNTNLLITPVILSAK